MDYERPLMISHGDADEATILPFEPPERDDGGEAA